MKRSFLLVVIAGVTTSAGAWLFAQSPKAQPAQPTTKAEEFTSSPPFKTTTVEAINLRNQFIELSKKKALLMKEPQLKREIEALEREIPELEAWAKAQEAVQILREVVEKHPNTRAAESANAAIRLIEERGLKHDGRFAPRPAEPWSPAPDPRFRRAPDTDSPGFQDGADREHHDAKPSDRPFDAFRKVS
ncbi:MAG TPA: hypothetical protein VEI07_14895 [Planctomycetaceae bacterium]|nr:hypothetical protein [Planctomycetaceae bacterium]